MNEDSYPTTYKHKAHKLVLGLSRLPYPICSECGFMNLRNTFSAWSHDKGCYSDLHPDYKRMRNKAGKK